MLNFNNFSIIRPILDLNMSLERIHQYLKLCLKGNTLGFCICGQPFRVNPRTLESTFRNSRHFFMIFRRNLVIVTHLIEYQYFTFRGIFWGHFQMEKYFPQKFYNRHKSLNFCSIVTKLFCRKNTFNNISKKHIIHFMGLAVVFFLYTLTITGRDTPCGALKP